MTLRVLVVSLSIPVILFATLSTSSQNVEAPSDPTALRVMTFNIRYDEPNDGVHAWPHRKERVASVVRFHRADLVGMQEALIGQIRDLEALLPGFAWVGVGRDDGREAGEFSPIFYRTDRVEVLRHDTFWLSETPEEAGSMGWNAAHSRIVTWAHLRDKRTDAVFYLFNTHFDHQSTLAQTESARLLADRVPDVAGDAPAVITGDFNVEETSEAYKILTEIFTDAAEQSREAPHGPRATFSGFEVNDPLERRIDYIFTSGIERVLRYGTLTDHWNGHYPSDHLPVLAEVDLR